MLIMVAKMKENEDSYVDTDADDDGDDGTDDDAVMLMIVSF